MGDRSGRNGCAVRLSLVRLGDLGAFGEAEPIDAVNTQASESTPVLSHDGLTLFYSSNSGRSDSRLSIWMATRQTRDAPFSAGALRQDLEPVQSEAKHHYALPGWLSVDQCRLYLSTSRDSPTGTSTDLYVARRP